MRRLLLLASTLAVLLGGCVAAPAPADPARTTPDAEATLGAAVVVADVGGGPNAYHEAYRRPTWTHHPSTVIQGFPADAPALELTFGSDHAENVRADAAVWDALSPGLYWIPGTNLLLYYHSHYVTEAPPPTDYFHGTATAGAVNDACPDCYVLVIRHGEAHLGKGVQLVVDELPWVDVVTQTGALGGTEGHPGPTRALWESGRVFVGPSGNMPVAGTRASGIGFYGNANYPPWVLGVGGSSTRCRGVEYVSGAPADFVSDFYQTLPAPNTTTDRWPIAGTSFAAPKVAGSLGQALLDVRRALGDPPREPGALWSGEPRPTPALEDGRLTTAELIEAFQRSARHFAPTDFRPDCADQATGFSTPVPAPPAAPWAKMGWGHVDAETAALAAADVLGEAQAPPKPAEARAFMDAVMDARRALYEA